MALGDRARRLCARGRGGAGAAALAVTAVATVVLWGCDPAPGRLAPVLSAVVTAALVEETVRLQRRRTVRVIAPKRGGAWPPTGSG